MSVASSDAFRPDDDNEARYISDASLTGSSKYDPNTFYPASRDKKGFGASLRITVPPTVLGEVSALVQKGLIPEYRTNHDFFRDAIIHRLHQIGVMLGDANLQLVADREAMDSRIKYELDVIEQDDRFIKTVNELVARANRLPDSEANPIYGKVRNMIADHPSVRVKREALAILPPRERA